MSAGPTGSPVSRRQLLAVPGAALFVAGCSSAPNKVRQELAGLPRSARRADADLLRSALDLEYRLAAAYTAALPLLQGPDKAAGLQFLQQEFAHQAQLWWLIKAAGSKPQKPAQTYDIGNPRDAAGVLALLQTLENAMVSAYVDAIPRFSADGVSASIASMMANDAQHLAVLRAAQGLAPVPAATVTGRE